MSAHANPDIIDDGLVFLYDTDDGKSYKGEPTTNLFPSPQLDNNTNTTVGEASITLKNFDSDLVGLEMIQAATSNIVSFSMGSLSSAVSGGTYTWSSYVNSTSIGHKVKAQVTVRVDGVRYWLTNSNTWTTSTTECTHLFAPTIANEWHRVDTQFTMPTGTLTDFQLGGWYRSTSNFTLRVANAQLELKSHATPFVDGTRSATQGLLDRTGNSTIDISDASFDSDAQMTFDGTDDYVSVPSFQRFASNSDLTIEAFVKPTSIYSYTQILGRGYSSAGYPNYYLRKGGGSLGWSFFVGDSSSNYTASDSDSINLNVWQHVVGILNRSENLCKIYVNGVLKQTADATGIGSFENAGDNLVIGKIPNSVSYTYFAGDIDTIKLYNRALTAAEVRQHFNAIKSRFQL